jgi:hypothetical protein
MLKYFKPSPLGIDLDQDGEEMAREIFLELCRKNGIIHCGAIKT